MRLATLLVLLLAAPAAGYEVPIQIPESARDRVIALCEIKRQELDPIPETFTVPDCIQKLTYQILREYDAKARWKAAAAAARTEGEDFQGVLSD